MKKPEEHIDPILLIVVKKKYEKFLKMKLLEPEFLEEEKKENVSYNLSR